MGKSHNSHAKKSDKETQSPLIKLFKDMIQKENNDPEKTKLLKEKPDTRKRKQYSNSRSKSDHVVRSCDSSSSERFKRNQYDLTGTVQGLNNMQYDSRSQNLPFQGDKKDSWWFWGSTNQRKQSEDTCSCVTCALKRLAGSEYTCIICLILLVVITAGVAFLMVFHTVPISTELTPEKTMHKPMDSEGFRKKLEMLADARTIGFGDELARLKDNIDDSYRKDWDDSLLGPYGGSPEFSGFRDSSFRDVSNLEDSNKVSGDLSSVMDKLNSGRSSENLKNFYKKLLQTDAQIKNLKLTMMNSEPQNLKTNLDRMKRSPKDMNTQSFKKFNIFYPPFTGIKTDDNIKRPKRHDNAEEPTGFVLEKKQIVVQYKDGLKRKEKCSHAPKDSKSHETQMKHPFYKNSQRLDELLDQFLDKNLPELIPDVIANPISIESLFSEKKKNKHPISSNIGKKKIVNEEKEHKSTDKYENDVFFNRVNGFDKSNNNDKSTMSDMDVILSVSTIMSEAKNPAPSRMPIRKERPKNARKLLQAYDGDDEGVGYEDLNEVLADDIEAHDDIDRGVGRQKRNNKLNNEDPSNNVLKYDSRNIHNMNWKNPMLLYPDELNTVIEKAAVDNIKAEIPVDNKDNIPEVDDFESGVNDVAYIEDYIDNKYDKLVKMAQAYSDYGVLEGKKEPENKKDDKVTEHRVKLSVDKTIVKKSIFGRLKKGTHKEIPATQKENNLEGVTFEFRPTTDAREDVLHPKEIVNTIQKHIKILPDKSVSSGYVQPKTFAELPASKSEYTQLDELNVVTDKQDTAKETYNDNNLIFLMANHKKKSKNKHRFRQKSSKVCENVTNKYDDYNDIYRKRALKSIVYDEELFFNDNESATKLTNDKETKFNNNKHDLKNKSFVNSDVSLQTAYKENLLNNVPANITAGNTGVDISEFFKMISRWFSTLASISTDDNNANPNLSSPIMKLTVNSSNPIQNQDITLKSKNTTDIMYPLYDSDMVDNIAHRSRVLMAVNEINKISTEIHNDSNGEMENKAMNNNSDIPEIKNENVTTVTQNILETITPVLETDINTSKEITMTKNLSESKNIVKRSLGDSGLIFWSDIYDDEYGLTIDPLENTIGGKRSNNGNDFMKRSGMWIQDKVKKITDNYFGGPKDKKKNKKRNSRSIKSFRTDMYTKQPSNYNLNRKPRFLSDDDSDEKSTNFADLTMKMKEVCKEAAKAVADTKIVKVRHNNKEETIATSLMQQLVHLMTDLVNFQVQQMTCLTLPPDLQSFLEWLTSPTPSTYYQTEGKSGSHENDYDKSKEENMELISPGSSEKEVHPETRSDCLGTLRSVQDLIQEYNDMSDEDKSKMSGVKDYLESQLDFLNRQIAFLDEYNFSTSYPSQGRFRRYVTSRKQRKYIRNKLKRSLRNKFRKIFNHFGKNRTKTVSNYYVSLATEKQKLNKNKNINDNDKFANKKEMKHEKVNDKSNLKQKDDSSINIKNDDLEKKRNLHDIYYKAVEDAKKTSTIKSVMKKVKD